MEPTYQTESVKISKRMEKTPEGFLWCYDVPIAKVGLLLYGAHETPVPPAADGITRIEVRPECLFEPESIKSLIGKSLVNEHPPVDQTSENWMMTTVGEVHHPRQGEGIEDDLLLADILVKDRHVIEDILGDAIEDFDNDQPIRKIDGKVEVSAGYDSKYNDLGGGRGFQRKRRYNHVALVESGRCGSTCSIRDAATVNPNAAQPRREPLMADLKKVASSIRDAFRTRDSRSLDEALEELEGKKAEKTTDSDYEQLHKDHEELKDRMGKLESAHKTHDKKMNDCLGKIATHDSDIELLKEKCGVETTKDSAEEREKEEKEKARDKSRTKDGEPEMEDKPKFEKETKDKRTKDEDMGEGDTVTDEALEDEAEEGEEKEARKAKDSKFLQSAFERTIQFAEIIAPGMSYKTMDSAADPKTSYRAICNLRRKALILGTHDSATLKVMEEVGETMVRRTIDAKTITSMPCNKVKDYFFAVGVAKRQTTRDSISRSVGSFTNNAGSGGGGGVIGKIRSLAEINEANRKAFGE